MEAHTAAAFDEVGIPRLVMAGAGSGTGKTSITCGVVSALRRRGRGVRSFKVGPDFADAGYLGGVAGVPCRSLDLWLLGRDRVLQSFHRGCVEGDIAVVEGMLGLLDSWGGDSDSSTAALARLLHAPVVLVLDVSTTVQGAAAVALGFKAVDPKVQLAGVILNRVENEEHARWAEEAVWRLAKLPVLGAVPELPDAALPTEGRALLPVSEVADFPVRVGHLADAVERHVDLDLLLRIAATARPLRLIPRAPQPAAEGVAGVRLGVAYDEAFSLYYPENLELLSEAGAEIVPFSPLVDHNLPHIDGVYLAGASSERLAERLAGNTRMLESLRDAYQDGTPIYAECGGLMYLAKTLIGRDGEEYPMAGVLPLRVELETGPRQMGYRRLRTAADCLLAGAGEELRGHEFHRSRVTDHQRSGIPPAYELSDAAGYLDGHEGFVRPALLASNIHLHFGQRPELGHNLLRACARRAEAPVV